MKTRFLFLLITALVFLPASSPWEGAAAVAPAGEIPETGRYVATNSFPPHTVVEIRNIENNRSTHAIVVKGLDSPGLLAMVSLEVAQILGMRSGSISRVRMLQPSDPMAYLRFSESLTPPSNPDYYISEEELLAQLYGSDPYMPPSDVPPPASQTAQVPDFSNTIPLIPPAVPNNVTDRGYVVDEPEWGGSGRLTIIDIPKFDIEPLEPFPDNVIADNITPDPSNGTPPIDGPFTDSAPYIAEPEKKEEITEVVYEPVPVTEDAPVIIEPVYTALYDKDEVIKDVPKRYEEYPSAEIVKVVPDYNPEEFHENINKDTPVYLTELPRDEVIKDVSDRIEADVPAEYIVEKEPEQSPLLLPLNEEEYIAEAQPKELPKEEHVAKDEPEVDTYTSYTLVEAGEQPPPNSIYGIDLNNLIPNIVSDERPQAPAVTAQPVITTPVPSVTADPSFSVEAIPRLENGQYYVQLAALPYELVENTIDRIDRRYNPKVFKDTDNLYRVLIGPLNQGESAAILQRFRTIGFNDAFVRRGF
ncbi:MAG: SPOR domain-containing protein [Treponema sp.]|nr:SPOR domain-containing protein [Treponema sp.]